MYCPKCGQLQVAEDPRYCSRCGFSLVEVSGLLARDAAPDPVRAAKTTAATLPAPARRIPKALYVLAASFPLLVIAALAGLNEIDGVGELFFVLSILAFTIGLLASFVGFALDRRRRRAALRADVTTVPVHAPERAALAPPRSGPIAVPSPGFDTGEIVQPPSVTEHTTRHLEQQPRRELER